MSLPAHHRQHLLLFAFVLTAGSLHAQAPTRVVMPGQDTLVTIDPAQTSGSFSVQIYDPYRGIGQGQRACSFDPSLTISLFEINSKDWDFCANMAFSAQQDPHLVAVSYSNGIAPAKQTAIFVRSLSSPSLVDADGKAAGGYWVLQSNARNDANKTGNVGFVSLIPMQYPDWLLLYPEFSGAFNASTMMFRFEDPNNVQVFDHTDFHVVYFPVAEQNGVVIAISASQYPGGGPFLKGETRIIDLGNYNILIGTRSASEPDGTFHPWLADRLQEYAAWTGRPPWGYYNIQGPGTSTQRPPAGPFRVLMRYFPDASQVGTLQTGEVALFSQCNFQGSAAVFYDPVGDLSIFKGLNLQRTVSVKAGAGTRYGVYTATNFSGLVTEASSDLACITDPVNSLRTIPQGDSLVIAPDAESCPKCRFPFSDLSGLPLAKKKLQNADLRYATLVGTDLTGADLTGADLRFANLTNAHMAGAILAQARFDHAILRGADLTGVPVSEAQFGTADLSCTTLAGTSAVPNDLRQFTLKYDPTCKLDLSYTVLSPDQLPKDGNWTYANYTGVKVLNSAGVPGISGMVLSTKAKPLNLSGAQLAGFDFDGVIADYLIAGTANLSGVTFRSAKLTRADFRIANAHGADFTNANLAGANFSGAGLTVTDTVADAAVFDQAFLRNVNFSSTDLTGVSFRRASFFGSQRAELGGCSSTNGFQNNCALATKATMNNTRFDDAFLYGVDFTSATLQGASFTRAVLIGSNFGSATLDTDPRAGTRSDFSSAYLQGAIVNSAASNRTTFQNAFVDFNPAGNAFNMSLTSDHTSFPGWNPPNSPVCVSLPYGHESRIGDNTTITCPSGAGGACGSVDSTSPDAKWASHSQIGGVYTVNTPTFGQKSAKICTANLIWMATDSQ